jgi:hypothetical protein
MKSEMRYAALLAALVLVLGLIAMPRAGAAGGNDDLEFLQPPGGEFGDPDIPGPNRYLSAATTIWWTGLARMQLGLRSDLFRSVDSRANARATLRIRRPKTPR